MLLHNICAIPPENVHEPVKDLIQEPLLRIGKSVVNPPSGVAVIPGDLPVNILNAHYIAAAQ